MHYLYHLGLPSSDNSYTGSQIHRHYVHRHSDDYINIQIITEDIIT